MNFQDWFRPTVVSAEDFGVTKYPGYTLQNVDDISCMEDMFAYLLGKDVVEPQTE